MVTLERKVCWTFNDDKAIWTSYLSFLFLQHILCTSAHQLGCNPGSHFLSYENPKSIFKKAIWLEHDISWVIRILVHMFILPLACLPLQTDKRCNASLLGLAQKYFLGDWILFQHFLGLFEIPYLLRSRAFYNLARHHWICYRYLSSLE